MHLPIQLPSRIILHANNIHYVLKLQRATTSPMLTTSYLPHLPVLYEGFEKIQFYEN